MSPDSILSNGREATHRANLQGWQSCKVMIQQQTPYQAKLTLKRDGAKSVIQAAKVIYPEKNRLEHDLIFKMLQKKTKYRSSIIVTQEDDNCFFVVVRLDEDACEKMWATKILAKAHHLSSENVDFNREISKVAQDKEVYLEIIKKTKNTYYRQEKFSPMGTRAMQILIDAGHEFDGDDFSDAYLPNVDFKNLKFRAPLNFSKAVLKNSDFSKVNLNGFDFTDSDHTGAIFLNAKLSGAIGLNCQAYEENSSSQYEKANKEESLSSGSASHMHESGKHSDYRNLGKEEDSEDESPFHSKTTNNEHSPTAFESTTSSYNNGNGSHYNSLEVPNANNTEKPVNSESLVQMNANSGSYIPLETGQAKTTLNNSTENAQSITTTISATTQGVVSTTGTRSRPQVSQERKSRNKTKSVKRKKNSESPKNGNGSHYNSLVVPNENKTEKPVNSESLVQMNANNGSYIPLETGQAETTLNNSTENAQSSTTTISATAQGVVRTAGARSRPQVSQGRKSRNKTESVKSKKNSESPKNKEEQTEVNSFQRPTHAVAEERINPDESHPLTTPALPPMPPHRSRVKNALRWVGNNICRCLRLPESH